jgi:hypothetical protein
MSEVLEPALGQESEKLKNNSDLTDQETTEALWCDKCGKEVGHTTEYHGVNGGARAGAGRKPGKLNYSTIQRMEIRKQFENRIHLNVDKLLNAAMNKALGETYLMKKVTERDSKGKVLRVYHEVVTDPHTIIDYLDGELEGNTSLNDEAEDAYYYMTTKPVDMVAVKELYDRAFGRAPQNIDMTSGGERIGQPIEPSQADQLLRLRAQRAA